MVKEHENRLNCKATLIKQKPSVLVVSNRRSGTVSSKFFFLIFEIRYTFVNGHVEQCNTG